MSERHSISRWLLLGGGALLIVSLILWLVLPIHVTFPPYIITTLLALAYSGFCRRKDRAAHAVKS